MLYFAKNLVLQQLRRVGVLQDCGFMVDFKSLNKTCIATITKKIGENKFKNGEIKCTCTGLQPKRR